MRKLIFIISIFGSFLAIAQQPKPQMRFITDSVMLGELVEVELTYQHPKEFEVLFPDSSFDYKPFEFVRKKLFVTRTNDSISSDCTIYLLQTFELDHLQTLQLGITLFTTKDSFIVATNLDSVFLKEMIAQMPDTLKLIENTDFVEVETEFNYPYFLIGLGILGVVGLISLVVFGKKILRKIQIYRIQRKHKKFVEKLDNLILETPNVEKIVHFWKNHIGFLEQTEFVSLTTKEINSIFEDEKLHAVLQNTDEIIFGGVKKENNNFIFEELKQFAEQRLLNRIKTIENVGRK